jgi:hypothetical protein
MREWRCLSRSGACRASGGKHRRVRAPRQRGAVDRAFSELRYGAPTTQQSGGHIKITEIHHDYQSDNPN